MNDLAVVTFWFSSLFIGPIWILMWFMPRHDITKKIVGDLRICVMPLIVSYALLLGPNLLDVILALATQMPTPDIVLELFSKDEMIILAWLHFLVMDTFAGRYIWMRMLAAERPIQISMPVLLFCMMAGPIGLLIGILATSDSKDDISIPSDSNANLSEKEQDIMLKAISIQKEISEWKGIQEDRLVSLGQNCNSSWYLKETGNKEASYPFDWIFSSQKIVVDTINDRFATFIDKENIVSLGHKAGNTAYHNSLFNHRNPLNSDEDYSYYQRTIERFLDVLDNGESIIFVITVVNEFKKRKVWYNGFISSMLPSFPQDLDSFSELIALIKSINKNVKFMFIEQYTECDLDIDVSIKTDEIFWLKFKSGHKNTGVHYLDTLDDTIMKIVYSGLSN